MYFVNLSLIVGSSYQERTLLLVHVDCFLIIFRHVLQVFKHVFNHTPGPCRLVPGKGKFL